MKHAPLTFPIWNGPPKASGRNWFAIRNAEDTTQPVEILIYDQIGKDWWDGSGMNAKDFADALKPIAKDREILVCINSPGGNVWDGLAIYHMLRERRDKVVCRIDGIAASIASIIALAGREVRMPRNSMMMIHDPSGVCMGDADLMREMADKLDKHKGVLVNIYEEKTGKPRKEIEDAMSAETWFTGEEAAEFGLADAATDEVALTASFDLSSFRHVPAALNTKPSAAIANRGEATSTPPQHMNRQQILALLRRHGQQVADDASDAQIRAALAQLPATEAAARTQAEQFLNSNPQPAPTPAPAPAPTAATPPPAARPGDVQNTDIAQLRNELNQLRTERDTERRGRIANAVQECVNEDRIPANQRDAWVNRAMADEAVLNDLRAMPARPPGAAPLNVDLRAEAAPNDVLQAMDRCNLVMASFMRGNDIAARDIGAASLQKGTIWNQHRNRLLPVMNTNTVPTGLKRQVILQEVIRDFARRTMPLRLFSTVFENVPLLGTDKVNVPFYDLDAGASTAFVSGTGYTTIGNTTTDTREITVGEGATLGDRLYQALGFSSQEIARQPFLNIMQLAALKAEKLASDMVADVLSVITAANYGTAAIVKPASAWGSDDLADLKLACKLWPEPGRGLMLDSAIDAELLKDAAFKSALNAASDSAIKEGRLFPRVFGFEYMENPTIPSNSENLIGFAVFRSAILVATAPVPPVEEVRNAGTQYQVVTDPVSGVTFEYRTFGNNVTDAATHVIEVNYGFAKGNGNALKRITTA